MADRSSKPMILITWDTFFGEKAVEGQLGSVG